MGQLNHEPSMEDILASIKRIIAEDSEAVGARTPKARREAMAAVSASPALRPVEHVAAEAAPERIDLAPVEQAPEGLSVDEIAAAPEAEPEPAPAMEQAQADPASGEPADAPDILELTSPMPEAEPLPARRANGRAGNAAAAEQPAPSVGQAAGQAVPTGADEGLVSSPAAQASRNAFAALGQMQVRAEEGAPNTLDGLVADLLRPMLREWLDRELPGLVERLVSAEVARLSGRG